MTAQGAVSRQKERGLRAVRIKEGGNLPPAVILVTPVVTAIGWDDWGDGNPEEQRQAP